MGNQQFEELNRRIDSLQGAHLTDQAEVKQSIKDLSDLIKPMVETYTAANKVGKWLVAIVTFISIIIGIVLGLKRLFK